MGLNRDEWEGMKAEAGAIIRLLRDRLEAERVRSGRSTLPNLQKSLEGMIPAPDFGRYTTPTPRMLWCLDVGGILNGLGHEAAYILMARLGRRSKSAERSWPRVLGEMEDQGMILTEQEAKAIFRRALPVFLCKLDAERITRHCHRAEVAA